MELGTTHSFFSVSAWSTSAADSVMAACCLAQHSLLGSMQVQTTPQTQVYFPLFNLLSLPWSPRAPKTLRITDHLTVCKKHSQIFQYLSLLPSITLKTP